MSRPGLAAGPPLSAGVDSCLLLEGGKLFHRRRIDPIGYEYASGVLPVSSSLEIAAWPTSSANASARSETPSVSATQGALLLVNDLPYLDPKKAAARTSKAAGAGKFMTNGKTRDERRIERVSFDAWRLEQRDHNLDAKEDDD